MRKALLVASGGGHLKQMLSLLPRLPQPTEGAVLVTHDGGLIDLVSRLGWSFPLEVVLAPYASPRDLPNLARDGLVIRSLLREERFDVAISTGAGIAVPALLLAARAGVATHYIESATRSRGPSLSGRMLACVPWMRLYTQHRGWACGRWRYGGSVFDEFRATPGAAITTIRSAVVSLGTMERYSFHRLVGRLIEILPEEADVLWQTGTTDVGGMGIDGRVTVPGDELQEAMREADVVVAHAGTGTALTALECGKVPVLVPRERLYGEHVDDHQQQTAAELTARGLAVGVRADDVGIGDLLEAAGKGVHTETDVAPFVLAP